MFFYFRHSIIKFTNLLLENVRSSIIDALCLYDEANLKEDTFFKVNQKIPTFILLIYFLSCLVIITWPNSEQKNSYFKLTGVIAVVGFIMIFLNIRLFFQHLIPELYLNQLVNLNRSLYLVPLIQLAVLIQMINIFGIFSWKKNGTKVDKEPKM